MRRVSYERERPSLRTRNALRRACGLKLHRRGAHSRGRVVFGLTSAGAALLPAVSFLNYGGPSSALCFVLGDATASRSLPRCARPSAFACRCNSIYLHGAWESPSAPLFPFEPADRSIVPTKSREGLSYDQETSRYRLVCLVRPEHHDHQHAIWQRSSEDRCWRIVLKNSPVEAQGVR
jgi:hypothetical protein